MIIKSNTIYRTRSGEMVRITSELNGEYPMLGYFEDTLYDSVWSKEGFHTHTKNSPLDLVEELPKEKYQELYL